MEERLSKYTDCGFEIDRIRLGRKYIVQASGGNMWMLMDNKWKKDDLYGSTSELPCRGDFDDL